MNECFIFIAVLLFCLLFPCLPLFFLLIVIFVILILKLCLETDYMSCLRQFLYPSEEDSYKLIRFLVEKLSESSEDGRLADINDFNNRRRVKENKCERYLEDWKGKPDGNGDGSFQKIGANLDNLGLISEVAELLNTKTRDAFDSMSHDDLPSSSTGEFNTGELANVLTLKDSIAKPLDAEQDASRSEETAAERGDNDFLVFGQKVTSSNGQSFEV